MMKEQASICLTERFDIYFEDALISKEQIIKKYADFFTSAISEERNSASVAFHTGSICFEMVALITAAIACVSLDNTDSESIIASLNENDMVLFRNGRYRWCGFDFRDGDKYIVLEQDGCGKNGKTTTSVPFDTNKNLIKPYYGNSDLTDGRGIRHNNIDRVDFISHILGIAPNEIPSVTGVSTVIVTERDAFDRLSKGLRIVYGEGKSIGLLDLVTASYYTDSGEEYQFGNNPAKTEPVLKITGKVSTARDLVLSKHGNMTVGFMVLGGDAITKGRTELADLLGRKSLKFAHVAAEIESEFVEHIFEIQDDVAIFACTREFLLQNSLPPQERNDLTLELDRQVESICNNIVTTEIVEGGCSWEDYRKAREVLNEIRKSKWNEEAKNTFIIAAYSLLNLFTTAVFPIEKMEKAVLCGKLIAGVSSPGNRIQRLWDLADKAESVDYHCAYVVDLLERLYKSGFSESLKYNALKRHMHSSFGRKVAVVIPKAYYADILCEDEAIHCNGINIITANRFDNSVRYDKIIVIGDINGKRFDPLKCRASADIVVLLYECETHRFNHKKYRAGVFEKKLNTRIGVAEDDLFDGGASKEEFGDGEDMNGFVEEELDLEKYIENISTFDIRKYTSGVSGSAGSTVTSDVCAIGCFVSGEQILFSKYYKAVVFNDASRTVSEIDAEKLSVGDQLVFVKRDNYTRNMIDYIYENLKISGRLSADVLDATEKAAYWKEALREYKINHGLSYRDIAKGLQKLGSSLQELSIRQWLIEESHIVGPRDETTLKQIAKLIKDSYLLSDTQSYFEACRVVRRQRKEILELIGKAITDKLSGYKPPVGSILEVVYDNVENLSEMLELNSITMLEEPTTIPVNLINKPIMDWEVTT